MRAVAFVAFAAACFCIAAAPAADPLARYDNHSTSGLTKVTGKYVNQNYGYSVEIPTGQVAWMDRPPSPNHGVNVYLGPRRSIEVDTSHDAALLGSTDALAQDVAGYVAGSHDIKSATELGGKPAEKVVQSFPGSDRRRLVVARWQDDRSLGDAINFVITLETTTGDYAADSKTVAGLLNTFMFINRTP